MFSVNILSKVNFYLVFTSLLLITNLTYSQNWTEKDESENYIARHEFGFTQLGDKFIMFGGRESAQTLDVYDYTTNTWSNGGEAPLEFNHFQAVTYEGLIWVLGAFNDNSWPESNADFIYMYNPASEEWIHGMEIPASRKRGAAGLVVYNDELYLLGGNTNGHHGGYVPYFDKYNPSTGIWTQLVDAPRARDHFQAVVYNNKLYAIGGRLTGGEGGLFAPQIPEVDVYDLISETWSTLNSSSNLPTTRAGAASIFFENEIFIIGGEGGDPNNRTDTVEALDPLTNIWTTKDNLNYARHGIQAIVSGNGIFVAGGSGSGGSSIKKMEYYGIDNPTGLPNINSLFEPDEYNKEFEYSEDDINVTIPITLSNTIGTTGTYIDSIMLSGDNFSLPETYNNIFLGTNDAIIIEVALNDVNISESNGTVTVTYNNNYVLTITLDGSQNLSIKDNTFNNIKVFPSPTQNSFSINISVNNVFVYDITGKLVKEFIGNFSKADSYNIAELSQNIYFIKISDETGRKHTFKLIKT